MKRSVSLKAVPTPFGLPLLFLLALLISGCSYPSDAMLERQFFEHEGDFEKLVRMAQEDSHLVRIATDFTWLDTDVSWPRKNVGISEERWNEYRAVFRRTGVPDGITKSEGSPSAVFFANWAEGGIASSIYKGIVFSAVPLYPVLDSLDKRPPAELYDKKGHVIAYRPIKNNWYIYYEEF
jgi:hypothetical protein